MENAKQLADKELLEKEIRTWQMKKTIKKLEAARG